MWSLKTKKVKDFHKCKRLSSHFTDAHLLAAVAREPGTDIWHGIQEEYGIGELAEDCFKIVEVILDWYSAGGKRGMKRGTLCTRMRCCYYSTASFIAVSLKR